ncbi:MAG: hypothetical protein QM718_11670 [Steroidobacteraceae bacterium]
MMNKKLMVWALVLSAPLALQAADKGKSAAPLDPLAELYGNTLVCQNQVTKAKCRLWVNPDGKYFAFFDNGSQPNPPDINGPFQIEGREGTYTVRNDTGANQLCLWIAAPRIKLLAEANKEMYSESACYALGAHKVGESWVEKDASGRDVKFWLMAGR